MLTPLDKYELVVKRLPVEVVSPGGWVTVHRSKSGDVTVTLRTGTLAKISEEKLAAELQAALAEAYNTYRDICRRLRRKIFGSDFETTHAMDDDI